MTTPVMRIGVVVPANNEQESLRDCLDALRAAVRDVAVPVSIVVVLDACTDGSAAVAERAGLPGVQVISIAARCVGRARAAGMSALLKVHGSASVWLATTDADSMVPANWLSGQLRHAARGARVVAGTVRVTDWGGRSSEVAERATWAYTARPHRHVHGANLSFAADAYIEAGEFPPVGHDEDVKLVDAFRRNRETISWATDIPVVTSARSQARAPKGFASYLSSLEDLPRDASASTQSNVGANACAPARLSVTHAVVQES